MMFGSWREEGAQRGGEIQADALADLHLVDATRLNSTRVLGAVMMFVSGVFSLEIDE